MSFQEDYMNNCLRYSKDINKICDVGYSVLGNITQIAIIDVSANGFMNIAANRPDFAEFFIENKLYKLHPNLTYSPKRSEEFVLSCSIDFINKLWRKGGLLCDSDFDLNHSIFYREILENGATHRLYCFCSDSIKIYNEAINNLNNVYKLISFIKKQHLDILEGLQDNKLHIANERTDYFDDEIKFGSRVVLSRRQKTINFLRKANKISLTANVSDREWQCFELYTQGKSATQTGEILGISHRTVETHFTNLKNKLRVESKAELMELLD